MFLVYLGTAGGLKWALLFLQCLFVAQEFAGSRERLADKTHIHMHAHTQYARTDDDVQPRCVKEPPQRYTMPGECSDCCG